MELNSKPRNIIVIKKKRLPFDSEIAVIDADRAAAIFKMYLTRCDNAESALHIGSVFTELGSRFDEKRIALSE